MVLRRIIAYYFVNNEQIIEKDNIVQEYYGSSYFGQSALWPTDKRLGTVMTATERKVWKLSSEMFRGHRPLMRRLSPQWHQTKLEAILIRSNLTGKNCAMTVMMKIYNTGDIIYKQGYKNDGVCVIKHDEVDVLFIIEKTLVAGSPRFRSRRSLGGLP
ncbi:hypothetical protein BIW11_09339 [Tropilaelaps mercedesae]|uniref:Cyclic nucleotide-binding domain-containing protein n=1 Tax=Tropilaelaps mercedesae TaxID=418985 RepID=A0A1V9XKY4_9ACAR|nr:hypothetical protein BIW11_09339 [Tropilaelaps mercedesae]